MDRAMLREVQVKNYKSIASCIVKLGSFVALVGPNGAGKSNFIDALRFVNDCLLTSITLALQNRGGINVVRRHSRGHPTNFGFRLRLDFQQGGWGDYSFEIKAEPQGRFRVKNERCVVGPPLMGGAPVNFAVEDGRFTKTIEGIRPKIEPDRLALSIVSATEEFRPIYDFLTHMRFYALSPDKIRHLQDPDPGEILKQDGSNAAAVLREVKKRDEGSYLRLCSLLSKVVPGTNKVEYSSVGQKETLTFKQDTGDEYPWDFDALSMSDGTLRVLGILLAIYQVSTPSLIALEEPEATIHPAALDVLVDILKDGVQNFQVVITTHSPEILDNRRIGDSEIRAVSSDHGRTRITSLQETTRSLIRQRLYSGGELLRMGELEPDQEAARDQERQLSLFGSVAQVA